MKTQHLLTLAAGSALFLTASPARAQSVLNGTFDANDEAFTAFPGYIGGANPTIDSWSSVGQTGINGGASCCTPFAPAAPSEGPFAFIQGQGSLSQTISGFTIGDSYTLTYLDAARFGDDGDTNTLTATIGTGSLQTTPVSAAWNSRTLPFTANATTLTLAFTTGTPPNDQTLDIDSISIVPEPTSLALVGVGLAGFLGRRRRS